MQDWGMKWRTEEITGVENAGLENGGLEFDGRAMRVWVRKTKVNKGNCYTMVFNIFNVYSSWKISHTLKIQVAV